MATTEIKLPPNVTWLTIPAGARSSPCRGSTCGRSIYFATNPKTGRLTPVDADVPGGRLPSAHAHVDASQLDAFGGEPTEVHDGRGVSHYITCPDRDQFSRGGGR